jgi:hypothetical protein
VHDEPIQLHEGPFVEQQIEPLARRELTLAVLRLEARLPAAQLSFRGSTLQEAELISHGHRRRKVSPAPGGF